MHSLLQCWKASTWQSFTDPGHIWTCDLEMKDFAFNSQSNDSSSSPAWFWFWKEVVELGVYKKLSDRIAIWKQNGLIYRHVEPSGSHWIKSMQSKKQTLLNTCLQKTAWKVNILLEDLGIMIPDADMGPGLERNVFYNIIPSLLSLWGSHYKRAFKDSGYVVCPEGLTRLEALLSDSREYDYIPDIWLYPFFASMSFKEKRFLSLLTATLTVEIYFHPSSKTLLLCQTVSF